MQQTLVEMLALNLTHRNSSGRHMTRSEMGTVVLCKGFRSKFSLLRVNKVSSSAAKHTRGKGVDQPHWISDLPVDGASSRAVFGRRKKG